MNSISLHTSKAHSFFIVPVKIKSDGDEFDNGHAIAEYSTQHPTTIAEQRLFCNVQLRRAKIRITKHLTLAILLVMLFQAPNIAWC